MNELRTAAAENAPAQPATRRFLQAPSPLSRHTSSRRTIWGLLSIVRAIATRCFSPPDSLKPRSPTIVSYPSVSVGNEGHEFSNRANHTQSAWGILDQDGNSARARCEMAETRNAHRDFRRQHHSGLPFSNVKILSCISAALLASITSSSVAVCLP